MGDTAESWRLACRDSLPERVMPSPRPQSPELHEVGGVLIGAEEKRLRSLQMRVHTVLRRHHAVQQAINIPEEGRPLGRRRIHPHLIHIQQDGPLAPPLRDVLVLHLLRQSQVVVLLKEPRNVAVVGGSISRGDQPDAAAGNVAKPYVEPKESAALHQVDRVGHLRVEPARPVPQQGLAVKSEGDPRGRGLEEIGQPKGIVEHQAGLKNLVSSIIHDSVTHLPQQLLVQPGLLLPLRHRLELGVHLHNELRVRGEHRVDPLEGKEFVHSCALLGCQVQVVGDETIAGEEVVHELHHG
mmetsp:Transcript_52399/g.138948  ORF Transcript_52399/g.138948 Transcript_52399/m.138948 type:complete len:297 (+) Transcript_52399:1335-2225(+)